MRIIAPPTLDAQEVYMTCVRAIDDDDKRDNHIGIVNSVMLLSNQYINKANTMDLYQLPSCSLDNSAIVVGNVTKKELREVYTQHMVGSKKPARAIYDSLYIKALQNICPFCGISQVDTLDHYLPKAKFPLLSVLPKNLVPSCTACNKAKTSGIATTKDEQCLHPYFDRGVPYTEQWLFAELIPSFPAVVRYYTNPPVNWTNTQKNRVKSHFDDFKLARKFSTQAGSELSILRSVLQIDFENGGADAVKLELEKRYNAASETRLNSWDTALYEILMENDWYSQTGFLFVEEEMEQL